MDKDYIDAAPEEDDYLIANDDSDFRSKPTDHLLGDDMNGSNGAMYVPPEEQFKSPKGKTFVPPPSER